MLNRADRNERGKRKKRFGPEQPEEMLIDFRDPPLFADGELAEILSWVDKLERWVKEVKEYALASALSGTRIPGWKVVEGRTVRKFADDNAAAARVVAAGEDPYEKKLMSVKALEAMLGKKSFETLLADLVVREEGKPVLVPEKDPRPEIVIPEKTNKPGEVNED